MVKSNTDCIKYFNNGYEHFSVLQEKALSDLGVSDQVKEILDRSLWAILADELISEHLTVLEVVKLSLAIDKYKKLPLVKFLKNSLKIELGLVC